MEWNGGHKNKILMNYNYELKLTCVACSTLHVRGPKNRIILRCSLYNKACARYVTRMQLQRG